MGGIYKKVRSRGLTQPTSAARSLKILTTSLALRGGGKAVVREARTGNYCFVLRVEGPATMDDLDPQLQKFLDSLSPPPDAAPSAD